MMTGCRLPDNPEENNDMKWLIFIRGEEPGGDVFTTVDDAPDAGDAIRRVKTALNGSVDAYNRDALCPELVALPGEAEQNQENASA